MEKSEAIGSRLWRSPRLLVPDLEAPESMIVVVLYVADFICTSSTLKDRNGVRSSMLKEGEAEDATGGGEAVRYGDL